MIYRKVIALTLTFVVVILAVGCSMSKNPALTKNMKKYKMSLSEDSKANEYDDFKNIETTISEYTKEMPDSISEDDFIAYYTYDGTSSVNDGYLVYKQDGNFKVEGSSFRGGDTYGYSGKVGNKQAFLTDISALEFKEYYENDVPGGEECYGLVIYESNGKTVATYTTNLFSEDY